MISIQKNFNEPTMPVDEQQFYGLVRATRWNELIDSFRQTGDQAQKRKLPAFIFQATFDETTSKNGRVGRWRKQAATRLTGLVVMDIDHVDTLLILLWLVLTARIKSFYSFVFLISFPYLCTRI